jgi:hypothetical protein
LSKKIPFGIEIAFEYNRNNGKRKVKNMNYEWPHHDIDSTNDYSETPFFLHRIASTDLMGWGLNHGKT